jgi:hypothetical protein
MSTTTKLLGFVVALLAVFGAAVGIGRAVGPVDTEPVADHSEMDGDPVGSADTGDMEDMSPTAASLPKGLMVSQDGYTFRLPQPRVAPGTAVPLSFSIEGPDGETVPAFDEEHEQDLHLIAVRRDFSGFQHVHPEMAADGTWTTTLDLTAGQWRLFADFKAIGGEALTLGNDLAVGGDYVPVPPPAAPVRTATVDGYTVTLDGDLTAGEEAELTLNVSRDGQPVADLEPYLGAYGHLVALRAGDLAYLHVHPDGTPGDGKTEPGPDVVFYAQVPTSDRYYLYLDFKHEGVVRTAAFTVTGSGSAAPTENDDETDEPEDGVDDGHDDDGAH